MTNGAFQEDRATTCEEIEELRKMCCAEAERARQLRSDEFSTQKDESKSTVVQLMLQIQELQEQVSSLNDAKEFL